MDGSNYCQPLKKKRTQSGGTVCCVPGCSNNTKDARHVSWHVFPKDRRVKDEWLRRIRRRGTVVNGVYTKWEPKYHHRVCGLHFDLSGVKQKSQESPTYFPLRPPSTPPTGRKRRKAAKLADLSLPEEDINVINVLTANQQGSTTSVSGAQLYRYTAGHQHSHISPGHYDGIGPTSTGNHHIPGPVSMIGGVHDGFILGGNQSGPVPSSSTDARTDIELAAAAAAATATVTSGATTGAVAFPSSSRSSYMHIT